MQNMIKAILTKMNNTKRNNNINPMKETQDDQLGTFISGLIYTGIIAIIILLIVYIINDRWFDYNITFILITMLCIVFFICGLKRVSEKNVGFLRKLGRRDFEETYAEGWWWIYPLWTFKQKPHFDLMHEAEEIQIKLITNDDIPLDINLKYYYHLKNLKEADNKYTPSFIKDTLNYELGKFVRNRPAIELLSDEDISNKLMTNCLINAGAKIGISISDVFPNINYEAQYFPVVRKYQEKYKDLKFRLDEILKNQQLKAADMLIYQNQIHNCINSLGFSKSDALTFMKVYKNQITMNESNYNIPEISSVLESVVTLLKK